MQPGGVVARAVGHDGVRRQGAFEIGHHLTHLQCAWRADVVGRGPRQIAGVQALDQRVAHGSSVGFCRVAVLRGAGLTNVIGIGGGVQCLDEPDR